MEKILKFKGKFPINPHLATINNNQISFYSEQSGNEEKVDIRNKSNKYPKHKTSKFIEEEEEEEKDEEPTKHHVNTLLIHKSNIKIFDTDNSEPNTPNDGNSKITNMKKSKFESLQAKEKDLVEDMEAISNQFYEVKIFSNFEAKKDHFTHNKVIENNGFSSKNKNKNANEMEIESDLQNSQKNRSNEIILENNSEQDVFKQQEEKLFKRNELKIQTTNILNKFQEEFMEINSAATIPKKKSKEVDIISHPFRHLIFSPHCSEAIFKRHLTIIYRGLIYARKCLKGPSDNYLKSKQIDLVSRIVDFIPKSKTLILDLDETLIHSCGLKEDPMHILKTVGEHGDEVLIGLNVRPFCLEFLQELSKFYEIFVFTASSFSYATAVLKFLDPYNKYISGLLSRSNCMQTKNGFFIKDLRIIRNKNLKDMIIVDNLAHSFGFQIDNGVPILEWHSGTDSELFYLKNYLLVASKYTDVREFNNAKLRLIELASKEPEELEI